MHLRRLRGRGIADLVWMYKRLVRRELRDEQLFCASCRYSARGLSGTHCPECGADLIEDGILDVRRRPHWLLIMALLYLPVIGFVAMPLLTTALDAAGLDRLWHHVARVYSLRLVSRSPSYHSIVVERAEYLPPVIADSSQPPMSRQKLSIWIAEDPPVEKPNGLPKLLSGFIRVDDGSKLLWAPFPRPATSPDDMLYQMGSFEGEVPKDPVAQAEIRAVAEAVFAARNEKWNDFSQAVKRRLDSTFAAMEERAWRSRQPHSDRLHEWVQLVIWVLGTATVLLILEAMGRQMRLYGEAARERLNQDRDAAHQ